MYVREGINTQPIPHTLLSSARPVQSRTSVIIHQHCLCRHIAVPAKIVSFGGLIERPWRTFIRLPCTAVGQPAAKRQWLKSFRAIQSWDGNVQVTEAGDMTITSLQRSNSDNYTCHVENIHGADSIIYQIIVQGMRAGVCVRVCVYDGDTQHLGWPRV